MKGLTKEQAVIITAITGNLFCKNFSDFQEEVEKKLGRSVWTHQFDDPEVTEETRKAFEDDFMEMMEKSYV